jgi:hypothetical protein
MRKYILFFVVCWIASPAFAEVLKLKSGKVVEGKIVEQGDDFVKIDREIGIEITYFLSEVETIDGKEIPVKKNDPAEITQSVPAKEDAAQISVTEPPVSAQGEIQGRPFRVEEVKFDRNMNTLKFRQGKDVFSELEVLIFLFGPKGPSWENTQLHFDPDASGSQPHVWKKWKVEGKNIPESKCYTSGYNLDLSLGEVRDGKIQGTIHLRLPDEQGSHVEGAFEALVDHKTQGRQNASVIITKDGKTITRPMTAKEKTWMGGVLGLILLFFVAFYVVTCIPFYLISKKLGIGITHFAWVPLFNIFLMLDLARKPGWWFILCFVPFVNVVIIVLIFCGIAETCRQPAWLGLLVLVPWVNVALPWYFLYSLRHTTQGS